MGLPLDPSVARRRLAKRGGDEDDDDAGANGDGMMRRKGRIREDEE